MAILQKQLVYDNSTQPNFQNWAQGISTSMSTLGMTKTPDTGQVDWITNPDISVANTTPYYELWQFADSLVSTCPVIIKLEYGASEALSAPNVQISIGTTSNGSGNLGGNIFGPYSVGVGRYSSAGAGLGQGAAIFDCNFSGAPGRFSMMLWRNCSAYDAPSRIPTFFAVERSLDVNGNYTGEYITALIAVNQPPGNSYSILTISQATLMAPGTGGMTLQNGSWVTTAVTATTTGFGGSSAFLPVFPFIGKLDNPLTVAGIVKTGDQTEAGVFTLPLYGNTRTYLYSAVNPFSKVGYGTNNGIAMRWD